MRFIQELQSRLINPIIDDPPKYSSFQLFYFQTQNITTTKSCKDEIYHEVNNEKTQNISKMNKTN